MSLSKNFKELTPLKKTTIFLSLIVLIISLTQPAFYIDRIDYDAWADSLALFFIGWAGFLGGSLASLLWVANPLYFFSIYQTIKGKSTAIYFSLLATTVAFLFSFLDTIVTSESGSTSKIISLQLGYILWLTSFIILTIGLVISQFKKQ